MPCVGYTQFQLSTSKLSNPSYCVEITNIFEKDIVNLLQDYHETESAWTWRIEASITWYDSVANS